MSSTASTTAMIVKADFNGDMRRFSFSSDSVSFDELKTVLSEVFELADCLIKYADDEGDLITVASDTELAEALSVSRAMGHSSLRLTVVSLRAPVVSAPEAGDFKSESKEGPSASADEAEGERCGGRRFRRCGKSFRRHRGMHRRHGMRRHHHHHRSHSSGSETETETDVGNEGKGCRRKHHRCGKARRRWRWLRRAVLAGLLRPPMPASRGEARGPGLPWAYGGLHHHHKLHRMHRCHKFKAAHYGPGPVGGFGSGHCMRRRGFGMKRRMMAALRHGHGHGGFHGHHGADHGPRGWGHGHHGGRHHHFHGHGPRGFFGFGY